MDMSNMAATTSPSPSPVVRPDNYSSIPSIVSWLTCVATLLCVIAKIATRLSMTRIFAADDVAVVLSLLFSIGMVISVSLAAVNGLGKYQDALSPVQIEKFEKSMYATNLLYVLTLFCSKGSLLFILRALTPVKAHLKQVWGVAVLLTVWTVTSLLASAFECSVPRVWAILGDRCFNQRAFWTYYAAMNIFTEMCLVVIPALVIKGVQMTARRKALIAVMFLLRALIVVPIAAEIYIQFQISRYPNRQTFLLWKSTVCMLFVQSLSIIFACVPFMRPFFATLEAGMIRVNETQLAPTRATFTQRHEEPAAVKSYRTLRCAGNGWTEIGAGDEMVAAERQSQVLHPQIILTTTTFEVRSENSAVEPQSPHSLHGEWLTNDLFSARSHSTGYDSRS